MIPRKLLPALLLVALAVRIWGLGFGLPYANSRVDETAIAGPAIQFLSGALRPPDFMYPTGFRYAVALEYAAWYTITRPFGTYASLAAFADSRYQTVAPFFYLSRALSAVMGTLTVWWLFAICRRVFDDTVAVVAALFTALAFLHVRDSHFGTIDVSMTALVVLTVLAILRWQQTPNLWRAAVAGLVGGLATSTKYNALGVWVPFVVAVCQQQSRGAQAAASGSPRLSRLLRPSVPPSRLVSLAAPRTFFSSGGSSSVLWLPRVRRSPKGTAWCCRAAGCTTHLSRCRPRSDGPCTWPAWSEPGCC